MLEDKDVVLEDLNQRMSLRAPQVESLARLAKAVEAAGLPKGIDEAQLGAQLAAVRALYPDAGFAPEGTTFDWNFLSFCFGLATGVGKTRLMGAIMAYLYRAKGIRNFLLVAPGKTIYEKLIADFTEGSPKYVFKGLSCFATKKPVVVTGDTYRNGDGITEQEELFERSITINIFTIQSMNERGEAHSDEVQATARIRRMNERLGESYFEYLKGLKDLVVLMDEAHHYRADRGAQTIRELQPVLGVEMTATPRVGRQDFGNVLYGYGLAAAMRDGFVKEPAVVRRENFRRDIWTGREDELDHQKLQDAMVVHEATKAALEEYAFRNGVEKVKPFVLVVAPDTAYADEIETFLKSDAFYGGKYARSIIKIYSGRKKEEQERAVLALLDIERPGNPFEIVIHVNMLSEGWDVTNLYTIVPLRAANSANLVEQTIGRGLRLPYGKRTGVEAIDTLSIVSHDRFDEIINAAREMQIEIKRREVPAVPKTSVSAVPVLVSTSAVAAQAAEKAGLDDAGKAALDVITHAVKQENLPPGGLNLSNPAVADVLEAATAQVLAKGGTPQAPEAVAKAVKEAIRLIEGMTIAIPKIVVSPGETTMRVPEFQLDIDALTKQALTRADKLMYDYVTDRRTRAVQGQERTEALGENEKARFVAELVDTVATFGDIDYDSNGPLVGSLCSQAINWLAGRLSPADFENCMRNSLRNLAEGIRCQIRDHAVFDSAEDREDVQPGAVLIQVQKLNADSANANRPFDVPLKPGEKAGIRNMVFAGFRKCLFTAQKFDSDPEREFSVMLEREAAVLKWFKPSLSNLRLWYGAHEYTPDFIVETDAEKLLCEVKASGEVDDAVVQAKKTAAWKWCRIANAHPVTAGDKPWRYLLVPDTAINGSLTLAQAVADFGEE
jgi:type III restriction enzyme